jgi:hypothetical protein
VRDSEVVIGSTGSDSRPVRCGDVPKQVVHYSCLRALAVHTVLTAMAVGPVNGTHRKGDGRNVLFENGIRPEALRSPRARSDDTRNGQTVNTIIAGAVGVLLVMIVAGLHDLQPWLERWEYQRHFED